MSKIKPKALRKILRGVKDANERLDAVESRYEMLDSKQSTVIGRLDQIRKSLDVTREDAIRLLPNVFHEIIEEIRKNSPEGAKVRLDEALGERDLAHKTIREYLEEIKKASKHIEDLERRLDDAQGRVHTIAQERNTAEQTVTAITRELDEFRRTHMSPEALARATKSLQETIDELNSDLTRAKKDREEAEKHVWSLRRENTDLGKIVERLGNDVNDYDETVRAMSVQMEKLHEENAGLHEENNRLSRENQILENERDAEILGTEIAVQEALTFGDPKVIPDPPAFIFPPNMQLPVVDPEVDECIGDLPERQGGV